MGLTVNINASSLEKWASELSSKGLRNSIRRAIDRSASQARKIAVETIAKDAGVPVARIRPGVTKLRRTTQYDLKASFTANKLAIGILNTQGATVKRIGGLSASTFRISGGGSSSLNVARAFIVNANGGRFVAYRKGKERLPIKPIWAEMPNTAMSQDKGAARLAWQKEAEKQTAKLLPAEIQRQLLAEGLPYVAPPDDGT